MSIVPGYVRPPPPPPSPSREDMELKLYDSGQRQTAGSRLKLCDDDASLLICVSNSEHRDIL